MAGLGWRSFSPAEILTAANLQGYAVDQSTMVFATAADRTTALAAPSQGMVSFLNDSGTTWQYFAAYSVSNPGGASAAGWYPISGAAMFYGTATKSTANGTTETLGAAGFLYTEIIDPLGWHSAVTNTDRITPTVAGLYRITPTIQWTGGAAAGDRRVTIFKNGAIYLEQRIGVGTSVNNNVSVVLSMNGSTDYFTVTCYQSSGGAVPATCQNAIEFLRPSQS
jgi:hypothetical protein